jgi:hypothetical protein
MPSFLRRFRSVPNSKKLMYRFGMLMLNTVLGVAVAAGAAKGVRAKVAAGSEPGTEAAEVSTAAVPTREGIPAPSGVGVANVGSA